VLPDGVGYDARARREGNFPGPLVDVGRLLYALIDVGLPDGRQILVDISSSQQTKANKAPALSVERRDGARSPFIEKGCRHLKSNERQTQRIDRWRF
jgi:hypothetical protein